MSGGVSCCMDCTNWRVAAHSPEAYGAAECAVAGKSCVKAKGQSPFCVNFEEQEGVVRREVRKEISDAVCG